MMKLSVKKRVGFALIIGFVAGALWLVALRFITYDKQETHYHANFAMYLDEEQQAFDSFAFYEEVQSCAGDDLNNPKIRTHMHDQVNHVVHVHDEAVTWAHFFANLGYTLDDNLVQTSGDELFREDDDSELTFILNGQKVGTIANQTIRSEDVLLVSYGDETDAELNERYEQITKDAADYNKRADPSACTGGKPATFSERLKAAVGLTQ